MTVLRLDGFLGWYHSVGVMTVLRLDGWCHSVGVMILDGFRWPIAQLHREFPKMADCAIERMMQWRARVFSTRPRNLYFRARGMEVARSRLLGRLPPEVVGGG